MDRLPPDTMDDPAVREAIGRAAMVATKVFESMEWRYGRGHGSYVPEVEALAHTFSELLSGLVDRDTRGISSGRLKVDRDDGMVDLYVNVGTIFLDDDGTWSLDLD